MATTVTDADVSTFIAQLLELGGFNTVDDSPDKYVRRVSTGNVETLTVDGHHVPIAIYGTRATDAVIICPFSEGDASSTKNAWFYSSRCLVLSGSVVKVIRYLLKVGAKANGKKSKEDTPDLAAAKYLSKRVVDVDDKMVKEFDSIAKDLSTFMTIFYNKGTRCGELHCVVFKKDQRKAHPSIRVKTWEVLEGLILDVLNVKSLSDFSFPTDSMGMPVFESFAHIFVNVYRHLKEPLEMVGEKVQHLESLESHLKYLPQYYGRAKWCVQPTAVAPQAVPTTMVPMATSASVPMVTSLVPGAYAPGMVPQVYNYGAMPMGGPQNLGPVAAGVPMVTGMGIAVGMGVPMAEVPMVQPKVETSNPFVARH